MMQSFWTVASVSPSVHTAHAILVYVYVCMSATSSFRIASVMSIRESCRLQQLLELLRVSLMTPITYMVSLCICLFDYYFITHLGDCIHLDVAQCLKENSFTQQYVVK